MIAGSRPAPPEPAARALVACRLAADEGELAAHHTIRRALPLSGGCISHALRLDMTAGASAFLKYRLPAEPGAGMFQAEADSLRALDAARALRVPAVFGGADASASWVLLEWLEPRPPSPAPCRTCRTRE